MIFSANRVVPRLHGNSLHGILSKSIKEYPMDRSIKQAGKAKAMVRMAERQVR